MLEDVTTFRAAYFSPLSDLQRDFLEIRGYRIGQETALRNAIEQAQREVAVEIARLQRMLSGSQVPSAGIARAIRAEIRVLTTKLAQQLGDLERRLLVVQQDANNRLHRLEARGNFLLVDVRRGLDYYSPRLQPLAFQLRQDPHSFPQLGQRYPSLVDTVEDIWAAPQQMQDQLDDLSASLPCTQATCPSAS